MPQCRFALCNRLVGMTWDVSEVYSHWRRSRCHIGPWGSCHYMIPSGCQTGLPCFNGSIISDLDQLWPWSQNLFVCAVSMFKCVCLVCFSVWGSLMLCGGCHLRLANLGSSRSAVRWGTFASLTSLGLHTSASDCLRFARIHPFLLLGMRVIDDDDFLSVNMFCFEGQALFARCDNQ